MKQLLITIAIFISASCQKELAELPDLSPLPDEAIVHEMVITGMCFDGTSYHVSYKVSGMKPTYKLYGGCSNGHDTLSQVQLMPRDGYGTFVAGTRESGCGVKVYLGVIRLDGKKKVVKQDGNCQTCE